jgi:hypothetical protein
MLGTGVLGTSLLITLSCVQVTGASSSANCCSKSRQPFQGSPNKEPFQQENGKAKTWTHTRMHFLLVWTEIEAHFNATKHDFAQFHICAASVLDMKH